MKNDRKEKQDTLEKVWGFKKGDLSSWSDEDVRDSHYKEIEADPNERF